MSKLPAETMHADATEEQLHGFSGLTHLRARKYGSTVLIESGPANDAFKHARLVRDSVSLWVLQIADSCGRWGHTGVRASREEAIATLVTEFGWVLTDVTGENPARTSDPEY